MANDPTSIALFQYAVNRFMEVDDLQSIALTANEQKMLIQSVASELKQMGLDTQTIRAAHLEAIAQAMQPHMGANAHFAQRNENSGLPGFFTDDR